MTTNEQVQALGKELEAVGDDWFIIETRIKKGQEFCLTHPDDAKAARLLEKLNMDAAALADRWDCVNAEYMNAYDANAAERKR